MNYQQPQKTNQQKQSEKQHELEEILRELDHLLRRSQALLRHPHLKLPASDRASWEALRGLWRGQITEDPLAYQRRIRSEE